MTMFEGERGVDRSKDRKDSPFVGDTKKERKRYRVKL